MFATRFALRLTAAVILFLSVLALSSVARAENLVSIMEQALSSDPRIKISEFQVEIGESQNWQALSALLPQLSAYSQFSHNERTRVGANRDSYKGEKYGVSASQVIFNFDAINNKIRTAKLVDQYGYQLQDVVGSVLLDVTERYLAVLGGHDNLALVQAEKESVHRQFARYQKLYEKGLVKVTDLLDARVRRDTIQADEIELINQLEVAREALIKLTGRPLGVLAHLDSRAEFPVVEGTAADWVARAKRNNPGLLARNMGVAAAEARVRQAYSGFMPRVDLQFSHQKSDIGFESAQVPRSRSNTASLVVNLPLFSGGSSYFAVKEARTQVQLEQMQQEELLREMIRSTREAYLNANSNWRRIAASQKRLESARESHKAMQRSFEYSAVTVVDVLDALQQEFEARRDLLRAKYAYLLAWLQLHYLAGELSPETIHRLNQLLVADA